jgi:pimeloyl-ACP methyl ester carboxylesterase
MNGSVVHAFDGQRWLAGWIGLALVACGPDAAPVPQASVDVVPCRIRGVGQLADCAGVQVHEDRDAKQGRKLTLRVVRLRARGTTPVADPIFMLAGGPGQAATEAYPPVLAYLSALAKKRDIVLVDRRGTGSSEALDCDTEDDLAEMFRPRALERTAAKCRPELKGDLTRYSTAYAADDLDDVRKALGYDAINLYGSSYGTRLALSYAQRHPEAVRSLVLDAVAPASLLIPLPLARDAQRAFDQLVQRCAAEASCVEAFPDLPGDLTTVLARLGDDGREIQLRHPRTGESLRLTITRDSFAQALRGLLYSPELLAVLPHALHRAAAGDFEPFVAQTSSLADASQDAMSLGLFLSVVCSEDVPRIEQAALESATANTFVGRAMVDEFRAVCAAWPRGPLPEPPREVSKPTLLLSGEFDPATPPRWAEVAQKQLPHSRHLVVPGAAHGVAIRSCVPRLLAQFFDEPLRVEALDASCIARDVPPLFIDFAGPRH